MINQVIIWGHRDNHTHGHIHSSYFKAFSYLGYPTLWLDNNSSTLDLNFDNTLFLTEGQVDQNIPINESSYYVLHHCNLQKYNNCKYIQLGNYLKFCEEGKNHYYPNDPLNKIKNQTFIDNKNRLLYQMWATDLTPNEINENNPILFNPILEEVNYIGSIWSENQAEINPFFNACRDNGKKFRSWVNISDNDHKIAIQNSYICPDIRGSWHKECGYIPCRIFKNISYGKQTGTNSLHVYNTFEGIIPYSEDTYELYYKCITGYINTDFNKLYSMMKFIKYNHTYVNRIETILNVLKDFYDK